MASSKLVVPQQHKGEVVAWEQKQNVVEAGGNNRRALGDIGNVVTVRGVEGKQQQQQQQQLSPQFHFHPSLTRNAQGAGENNNKKQQVAFVVDEAVGGKDNIGKAALRKKVTTFKPKPEEVIEISPNTAGDLDKDKIQIIEISPDTAEDINKDKVGIRRASLPGLSKKRVQTLTALLNARSKAACGVSHKGKDRNVNIDAADVDNPLAGVEYVDDLYKFYKLTECSTQIHDYMNSQPHLNEKMRAILVDWLIDVHKKFQLRPESLYLTINVVDRYLSMKSILREELQLVGVSAMLIASKYEELWAPEVNGFICITNRAYTKDQVLLMEKSILRKLEWNLTIPTPYMFLLRFIKAAGSDQKLENMAFFLAELALMNYANVLYYPSMLAASAVYTARCTLRRLPLWTETLELHTGFSEPQLMDCAKVLVNFHLEVGKNKLQIIYKKYSSPERNAVALFPPAKNLFY